MFEELNQHRAAVAENIQKATEIGFTGNELEKAHKVGDVHPNGKWVWTQLPSGRYDWRVIKRTSGGSAPADPATAQKKPISISANHPAFSGVAGVDNVKEYLTTFNSKYTDLSKVTLSRTPKGNWDVRYDGHRLGILNGAQIPESSVKKMGWMKTDSADLTRSKRDAEEEAKKEFDYEIGGKVTSKNFDSFAKLVNSKKNNFYVVDTIGGRRHRGGRMTSVASDSGGNVKIRIHWMGNGENEKKEFYSKDQAAYWLNGLDFDVEKKK